MNPVACGVHLTRLHEFVERLHAHLVLLLVLVVVVVGPLRHHLELVGRLHLLPLQGADALE